MESGSKANLRMLLGANVRRLRKQIGLSQEAFADMCDLHRTQIGAVERGEKNLTLDSLEKIVTGSGVRPAELFHEEIDTAEILSSREPEP